MDVDAYRRQRRAFFSGVRDRWTGTLTDAFDVLAPYPITPEAASQIRAATRALSRVYERAATWLGELSDDELRTLGVPAHWLTAVKATVPAPIGHVFGRFDFVRTADGYRMLEFNVDAAGLIIEAFALGGAVCGFEGLDDPNSIDEPLLQAALRGSVSEAANWVAPGQPPCVAVAAPDHQPQERDVGLYLTRLLQPLSASYVTVESLTVRSDGLYAENGRRIDVLVRAFPLHCLRPEALVGRLVADRRVALINPPRSFVLESKGVQAVLWSLAQSSEALEPDEREAILRYMLPTFMTPLAADVAHVVKPLRSIEGDSVRIHAPGAAVIRSAGSTHDDAPKVYQHYVALPAEELMTEDGMQRLHLVTSCFSVLGEPAGICMRAGGPVTDGSAWVVPLYQTA